MFWAQREQTKTLTKVKQSDNADSLKQTKKPKVQPNVLSALSLLKPFRELGYRYKDRLNNFPNPIYKGHFVNFHSENLDFPEEDIISGIEDGFAYFAQQNVLTFYFYTPNQSDLNFYYNTDQNDEKYQFPLRIKKQKLHEIDQANAFAFQFKDKWTMAVASNFDISFYQFEGELENFHRQTQWVINSNGELIHQMKFFKKSIIYGGDSGTLKRVALNAANQYKIGLGQKIKKTLNRVINDFNVLKKDKAIIQIEIDVARNICYCIVEYFEKDLDVVSKTELLLYTMGINDDRFEQVVCVSQLDIFQKINTSKPIDLVYLQFFHIFIFTQGDSRELSVIITTKQNFQLQISFEMQLLQNEDYFEYVRKEEVTDPKNIPICWRPTGQFDLFKFRYPNMEFQENSYGVCIDDNRLEKKSYTLIQINSHYNLKSVYRETNLTLQHINGQIVAKYLDVAHTCFRNTAERNVTNTNEPSYIYAVSLYRDTSREAVESVELTVGEECNYTNQIGKLTIKSLFNNQDLNDGQVYNYPDHFVCIGDSNLEFLIQLRPVDLFFIALKVTHIDFIDFVDTDLPLEKLIRAYGIEESCTQILQIIIQEDQDFFVNVGLEQHSQQQIGEVIKRIHETEFIQKYFEQIELTPKWVIGKIYVRKGELVKDKAIKAYYSLIKRCLYLEKRKSKKVQSSCALLQKLIKPLTQNFLNKKAYDLECNQSIENYSLKQLRTVQTLLQKLLNLFNSDQDCIYQKIDQSQTDQNEQALYVNGFSKMKYEQYDQNVRDSLNTSRETQYNCNVSSDYENNQMKSLQKLTKQIYQIISFFIYFFGELEDIRSIINSFADKENLFKYLSLQYILDDDQKGMLTLKQMMIQIIKRDKTRVKENAEFLCKKFSEFFTPQDCKISIANYELDKIIMYCAQQNIIKIEEQVSMNIKIMRLLKFSKNPQLTIERILQKQQIYIYNKLLPKEIQAQLKQAFHILEEVIYAVSHYYIFKTFKIYMYPFASFKEYFQFILIKCQQLEKSQSIQFRDCAYHLLDELNLQIKYLTSPPKGLTTIQAQEILIESLSLFKQYQNEHLHQIVANTLQQSKLSNYIMHMNSPFELRLNCSELERLLILSKQPINQDDYETKIKNLLQLAQINLEFHSQLSYEEIMQKLSLNKRIEYLEQVKNLVYINNQSPKAQDLKDYDTQACLLIQRVFLQDIIHEYLVLNEDKDEHINSKRKIVIQIFEIKKTYQFFVDNDIYFAQLVCLELIKEINFSDQKIEKLWSNFFYSHLNDLWPSSVMQYQLKVILDKVNHQEKYIKLHTIVECVELINSQRMTEKQDIQIDSWIINLMLDHFKKQNVPLQTLLVTYLDCFCRADSIQNHPICSNGELIDICVTNYKIQLAQITALLWKYMKRSNLIEMTPNLKRQIRTFKSNFELLYIQELLHDDKYNEKYCEQLNELVQIIS